MDVLDLFNATVNTLALLLKEPPDIVGTVLLDLLDNFWRQRIPVGIKKIDLPITVEAYLYLYGNTPRGT